MKTNLQISRLIPIVLLGLFLLGFNACSTQMPSDAEIQQGIDSTMIHPMNPDPEDVSDSTAIASDSLKIDTGMIESGY